MVIYLLHKDTRKYAIVPKKRWIMFHNRSTWGFMEEATRCVLQVASPLNACGRSSMDLNGSRRNPGGDIVEWRLFVSGDRGPFSTWRLVSLVFVCCPGHLSALGVNFLDRFLALATPLIRFLTTVRSPSCSRIGV